jgi:two-component system, OmpR family, sensor histidine kinase QseC
MHHAPADAWPVSVPGARVRLSMASVAEGDRRMALLRVQDDGPGIPEHDRERVFERFYCTDGGRRAPGFGMGLSLVQRVVAAHGGQVRCEAGIDGRGCGIEVRLPLRG